MEKISLPDHGKNEKVLQRVKDKRRILHTIQRRKANWIGQTLCRKYLLKQAIEWKLEEREREREREKEHNVNNNWMQLRLKKYANLKDEHKIALCGELALEEVMNEYSKMRSKIHSPSC